MRWQGLKDVCTLDLHQTKGKTGEQRVPMARFIYVVG